jgi:hypothetical protein
MRVDTIEQSREVRLGLGMPPSLVLPGDDIRTRIVFTFQRCFLDHNWLVTRPANWPAANESRL